MNMTGDLKESQNEILQIQKDLKSVVSEMTQKNQQNHRECLEKCVDELQKINNKIEQVINFTYFGQKSGGMRKTKKKTLAVRENGKKGGRPSKKILVKIEKSETEDSYQIFFNDGSKKTEKAENLFEIREKYPISRYKWSEELEKIFEKL